MYEKCWWFFKYQGKWWDEEDLMTVHGLSGLEDAEESVKVCIYTEKELTWRDAKELLKQLVLLGD